MYPWPSYGDMNLVQFSPRVDLFYAKIEQFLAKGKSNR